MSTHPNARMLFPRDYPPEMMYRRQNDWPAFRRQMEKVRDETTIGWTALQRRGTKRWPESRLRSALGDDIEVYRKPSLVATSDMQPDELASWTKPADPKLSQLGIDRKTFAENPLWDVWVRIKPTDRPDMQQHNRANAHLKNMKERTLGEDRRRAYEERVKDMLPEEREYDEARGRVPKHMEEKYRLKAHYARSRVIVEERAALRYYLSKEHERKAQAVAEAMAIHDNRIKAGRARLGAATAARRGES